MDELVQGLVAVVVNAVQELQHDEVPLSELLARAHPADVDGPLLVARRRVHHEDAEVLAERLEIIGPVAERVQLFCADFLDAFCRCGTQHVVQHVSHRGPVLATHGLR